MIQKKKLKSNRRIYLLQKIIFPTRKKKTKSKPYIYINSLPTELNHSPELLLRSTSPFFSSPRRKMHPTTATIPPGGRTDSPPAAAVAAPVLKNEEEESTLVNHVINNNVNHDEYFDSFPPGYRFCPQDEELILDYLKKKVLGEELPMNKIMEVNLYRHDPDTLATYSKCGEKDWYFFTPRDRKYPNGDRPNRAAGDGYWKATGADKRIMWDGEVIGLRKALVYYTGKPPKGVKTNWIMHEFKVVSSTLPPRAPRTNMQLDDYVLCRIYKKAEKYMINRSIRYSDDPDPAPAATTINVVPSGAGANHPRHVDPTRFNDNNGHDILDDSPPPPQQQPYVQGHQVFGTVAAAAAQNANFGHPQPPYGYYNGGMMVMADDDGHHGYDDHHHGNENNIWKDILGDPIIGVAGGGLAGCGYGLDHNSFC
ncbi:unnamed protein product [Linum tenue]|uniref:NAC domain-containing protein n=2 Tax=Linum tenue TaxID=586396 RepID=A0AAV0L0B3_9ROSI|nr:unnamed protein product [Linum tenue]